MLKLSRFLAVALPVVVAGCGSTTLAPPTGADSPSPAGSPIEATAEGSAEGPSRSAGPAPTGAAISEPPASIAVGEWVPTGEMIQDRFSHLATVLPSGMVLVVGGAEAQGNGASNVASAELFDPQSETWTAAANMKTTLVAHSATLLPNGDVLVVGVVADSGNPSAELYRPSDGDWTVVESPSDLRGRHSATLLPDGKVLVAGGGDGDAILGTAEVFDPATAEWKATGSMVTARTGHTATLLPNGLVLVSGGVFLSPPDRPPDPRTSAELYDPNSGSWSMTGAPTVGRNNATQTLLASGKVLVVGGDEFLYTSNTISDPLDTAEIYDPETEIWTVIQDMNQARHVHTATLLDDGTVLVAGSANDEAPLKSSELFDPLSGHWFEGPDMAHPRFYHSASLLEDGSVLVAGGIADPVNGHSTVTAEIYLP
jgi:Kelch motif/Galactose oxidase, central domain